MRVSYEKTATFRSKTVYCDYFLIGMGEPTFLLVVKIGIIKTDRMVYNMLYLDQPFPP